MAKSIVIPGEWGTRTTVIINNETYTYPNGVTVTVPDEVAALIEDAVEMKPMPGEDIDATAVILDGGSQTIDAKAGTRYVCGELTALTISHLPASGIVDIVFKSGSVATTLTLPASVMMPSWFSVEANQIVEINIMDGKYGSAQIWETD